MGSSPSLQLSYFGGQTFDAKESRNSVLSSSVLPVTLRKGGNDNEKSHCVQSFIL